MGQACLNVGVCDLAQILPHRAHGADSLEALLRIAPELLQMPGNQSFEQGTLVGRHRPPLYQDLPERPSLGFDPAVEPVKQPCPVYKIIL